MFSSFIINVHYQNIFFIITTFICYTIVDSYLIFSYTIVYIQWPNSQKFLYLQFIYIATYYYFYFPLWSFPFIVTFIIHASINSPIIFFI